MKRLKSAETKMRQVDCTAKDTYKISWRKTKASQSWKNSTIVLQKSTNVYTQLRLYRIAMIQSYTHRDQQLSIDATSCSMQLWHNTYESLNQINQNSSFLKIISRVNSFSATYHQRSLRSNFKNRPCPAAAWLEPIVCRYECISLWLFFICAKPIKWHTKGFNSVHKLSESSSLVAAVLVYGSGCL